MQDTNVFFIYIKNRHYSESHIGGKKKPFSSEALDSK